MVRRSRAGNAEESGDSAEEKQGGKSEALRGARDGRRGGSAEEKQSGESGRPQGSEGRNAGR